MLLRPMFGEQRWGGAPVLGCCCLVILRLQHRLPLLLLRLLLMLPLLLLLGWWGVLASLCSKCGVEQPELAQLPPAGAMWGRSSALNYDAMEFPMPFIKHEVRP